MSRCGVSDPLSLAKGNRWPVPEPARNWRENSRQRLHNCPRRIGWSDLLFVLRNHGHHLEQTRHAFVVQLPLLR